MVNRSRNMKKNRSRSRRMRGGQTSEEEAENAKVANENAVVANENAVVANENENENENSSWLSSIPGASAVTGAFDTAKEGTSSFLGNTAGEVTGIASTGTDYVKSFLPGAAPGQSVAPGAAPETVAPGQSVAPVAQGTGEKKWWQIFGGKRSSRQMRMKGGRDLGLDYYATPVSGLRVAQPTYMEYYNGGKRSSKQRRTKRRSHRRKRRTCKRRTYRRRR